MCPANTCKDFMRLFDTQTGVTGRFTPRLSGLPYVTRLLTGCVSSIGRVSAWHASGLEFDPQVRHILSWRLGLEKNSTAILPLLLIQEEKLSVTGERMCTKYW